MRKRIICGILVATFSFLVTACGDTVHENASASSQIEQLESEQNSSSSQSQETLDTPENEEQENNSLLNMNQISLVSQHSEQVGDEYYNLETKREYFTLDENSANRYPKLAKTLNEMKLQTEDSQQSTMDYLIKSFRDMAGEFLEPVDLMDKSESLVLRADNIVFSYVETNENYYGGAHGGYNVCGQAFDVETGEKLTLFDIIKDDIKMKDIVAKRLDEDYGDIFFNDVYALIESYDLSDFTWSMDYFGLTLYFNQYELTSYDNGMQTVFLSFTEYPELFAEKFMTVPEQYIVELSEFARFSMDVNCDGIEETIELKPHYYEDDWLSTIISIDGKEADSETRTTGTDYFLVKCKDKVYIYLFELMENDYSSLLVFDLDKKEFVQSNSEDYINAYLPGQYDWEYEEDGYFSQSTTPVFNNPERFVLASKVDILSTYSGTKTYHVGEYGIPVSDDEYYAVDVSFLICTKADIPCKLVKADGTVVEENSTVPEGTYFKIVSAAKNGVFGAEAVGYIPNEENGEYFAVDENTAIKTDVFYSIQLDEDYGSEIGGIEIWDLFEGLLFAG